MRVSWDSIFIQQRHGGLVLPSRALVALPFLIAMHCLVALPSPLAPALASLLASESASSLQTSGGGRVCKLNLDMAQPRSRFTKKFCRNFETESILTRFLTVSIRFFGSAVCSSKWVPPGYVKYSNCEKFESFPEVFLPRCTKFHAVEGVSFLLLSSFLQVSFLGGEYPA